MAKSPSEPGGGPFDIAKIKQLVRLMRDNDLSEIDLRWDDSRICLRRGNSNPIIQTPMVAAPVQAVTPNDPQPAVSSAVPAEKSSNDHILESPLVGTFYVASSPDAEPFVSVGSKVNQDSIVCIVEAMKVFNEIPAQVSGAIREILVENGAAVEYGQPLFRVELD